ncbi:MAG TPA: ABC transporter permease subunit [Chthoniobacteraceae bacterium]|jgi:ABC-type transport system involved in multi-copper enzyme maturation permease subunit
MNARLARLFSFPLLGKELTETAARRRTYVIRAVYAVLLYAVFGFTMPEWLLSPSAPSLAMGVGRQLYEQLCLLQMVGIVLFLPATMCGAIAQEKERESLVLLFLTNLRPWQIVLQKYFGGLMPMLTFLLLGMPLAAVAYAFGGVTVWKLFAYLYALLLTCLQIGAIALLCSAWCRTSVGAFISTYFLGAAFYGGPILVYELFDEFWPAPWEVSFFTSIQEEKWALLIPLAAVEISNLVDGSFRYFAVQGIPSLLSVPLLLGLARYHLVRRAFIPASNPFLRPFRWIDGWVKRGNRLVGNVVFTRGGSTLPEDAPIFWRETTQRALGKANYLVRILLVVEIVTLILCLILTSVAAKSGSREAESLSVLAAFVAGFGALTLAVQAANIIVSERLQQTLEVLLTTELTARQIILEKAGALRRLMLVIAIPLLTIFGIEFWFEQKFTFPTPDGRIAYLVCAVLMTFIYLHWVMWLCIWIGLRVRKRFSAILIALAALVLWCVAPIAIYVVVAPKRSFDQPVDRSFTLLSPVTLVAYNEASSLHELWNNNDPWRVIIANAALFSAFALIFQQHALTKADRWLRR